MHTQPYGRKQVITRRHPPPLTHRIFFSLFPSYPQTQNDEAVGSLKFGAVCSRYEKTNRKKKASQVATCIF